MLTPHFPGRMSLQAAMNYEMPMSLHAAPKFTSQPVSPYYSPHGGLPYEEIPDLMSGDLQTQCQNAFRHYLAEGVDPQLVAAAINNQFFEQGSAWPVVALNAAYALSRPCDDLSEILAFTKAVCDSLGKGCFKSAQKITRCLVDANPINPYLVYKNLPLADWGVLDQAYGIIKDGLLIKLAVLFDDSQMVGKIAEYDPQGYSQTLALALAEVVYDPLSNARSWIESPHSITMLEVEKRINRQFNSIRSPLDNDYFLSRVRPDLSRVSDFIPGRLPVESFKFDSTDHHLRHVPRYFQYLALEPDSIGRGLQDLNVINNGDPERNLLAAQLIEDLIKAGLTASDIHFRYCRRMRLGEILDLADRQDLQTSMVVDLLKVSERGEDIGDSERVISLTLLGLADPSVVRAMAVTDTQLRSAFMATKERGYLERLSGKARDAHIGSDLGL